MTLCTAPTCTQQPATRRRSLLAVGLSAGFLALGVAAPPSVWAQDAPFPAKPIRFVIPTTAGGNLDLLARTVGGKLAEAWGQQVVIEPRPGANTMLATSAVAKSPADGYTVLFTISGFVQNLVLQANPPYKVTDLTPVSMVAGFPIALAANANLPANDLTELVKIGKEKTRRLSYGSYGMGSGGHIIGEGLNKLAGIAITHVPYKGEAASFPELVSGDIDLAYGSVGFYARQLSTGKIKLLAVASPRRLKTFPTVPTFAEAGYEGVNLGGWGGMFLPAGTPPAIVEKFVKEVQRIVALPDVQTKIYDMGFEPVGNTSAEFAKVIANDLQRWGTVVKDNNIKLE